MADRRVCVGVPLADGAVVRVQTNGKPLTDDQIKALQDLGNFLINRCGDQRHVRGRLRFCLEPAEHHGNHRDGQSTWTRTAANHG